MRMTQVEYAKRKGVTPQYINKLVNRGVIRKIGRLIDSKQADAAIRANSQAPERSKSLRKTKTKPASARKRASSPRPKATGLAKTSATRNLTAAKADREHYQALMAKLEYEKAVANLLPREQVLVAEQRKNANVRTQFRKLARSVAPLLARVADPAEIENLLREEIDVVLGQLARDPLGGVEPIVIEPELAAAVLHETVPAEVAQ
jgi:DNA-binding Lrp family transcriptional regulator